MEDFSESELVEVQESSKDVVVQALYCPECGTGMYVSGHCATCPECGWSLCSM